MPARSLLWARCRLLHSLVQVNRRVIGSSPSEPETEEIRFLACSSLPHWKAGVEELLKARRIGGTIQIYQADQIRVGFKTSDEETAVDCPPASVSE